MGMAVGPNSKPEACAERELMQRRVGRSVFGPYATAYIPKRYGFGVWGVPMFETHIPSCCFLRRGLGEAITPTTLYTYIHIYIYIYIYNFF